MAISRPRIWRSCSLVRLRIGVSWKRTRPPVMRPACGSRLSIQRASVVFPDPLSPVITSVPPSGSESEMWLVALTIPSGVTNSAVRSSMRRIGAIKRPPIRFRPQARVGACIPIISAVTALVAEKTNSGETAEGQYDLSLDLYVGGVRNDGRHRLVSGLQADTVSLSIEFLQRGFLLILEPRGNHLPVVRGVCGLHQDNIAVVDQGVDHRVALNAQRVDIAPIPEHIGCHLDRLRAIVAFPRIG